MFDIILVIITLGFLLVFSYKGYNVTLISVVNVLILGFFAFKIPTIYLINNVFMNAIGDFVGHYALLFILGSLLGKIFSDSGLGISLANFLLDRIPRKAAIIVAVLMTSIFPLSGMSLLIVPFIVYPIVNHMFYRLDISKKFVLPTIVLGGFSYTMSVPGSAQVINIIPTQTLGTTIYAAPAIGLLAATIVLVLGISWLTFRINRSKRKGKPYGDTTEHSTIVHEKLPSPYLAFAVILFIALSNIILINFVFTPNSYLAKYVPNFVLERNRYAVQITLIITVAFLIIMLRKYFINIKSTLMVGVNQAILTALTAGSVIGYGSVVIKLDAINNLTLSLVNTNLSAYTLVGIISSILGIISGSATGGMSILYHYISSFDSLNNIVMAANKDIIHRISTIGVPSFAVLPHHGGLLALIAMSNMTYKRVYLDIFIVGCLIPLISLLVVLAVV